MKRMIYNILFAVFISLAFVQAASAADGELKALNAKMQECYEKKSLSEMTNYAAAIDRVKYSDSELDGYYYGAKLSCCRLLAEAGNINGALDVALQMDQRVKETGSREGALVCYEALGAIYFSTNNYAMAVEAYATGLQKREEEKMLYDEVHTRILAYMLWACARNGQWDMMDTYLPQFWKNGYELMYNALSIIRQCYNGKPGDSEAQVKEAEKYLKGANRISLAVYEEAMSRYYETTGQYAQAISMMQNVLRNNGIRNPYQEEHLSTLYAAAGNDVAADSLMRRACIDYKAMNYVAYIAKLGKFQREYQLKSMEFAKHDDVNKMAKTKYYVEIIIILLLIVAIVVAKYLLSKSQNLSRDLKNAEVMLRKDTEDLMQKRRRMSAAVKKTKDTIKLKSSFLSNMTHEIRTPLNSILGFSELITSLATSEEHKEFAEFIRKESSRLLILVNNILDLARVDSGKMKLEFEECNVYGVLREAVYKAGDSNGMTVKTECPEDLCIFTDSGRFMQIVVNMLSNAFKFAKKGEVRLIACNEEEKLILRCEDEGPGIPTECAKLVFERFEKLGKFEPGTGLGLSICSGVAGMLGGTIYVDTEYHKGAAFVLELPVNCQRGNMEFKARLAAENSREQEDDVHHPAEDESVQTSNQAV